MLCMLCYANNGIKKEIEVSKIEKDLGVLVMVNNELKWSDQCGKAAGEAVCSWSYRRNVRLNYCLLNVASVCNGQVGI